MAHGLVKASFVPDQPTQQMRDLLRTHKQFGRERSSHNSAHIQKTLEDANIKLDLVVTDGSGSLCRRILQALIAGQTTTSKRFCEGGGHSNFAKITDEASGIAIPFKRPGGDRLAAGLLNFS